MTLDLESLFSNKKVKPALDKLIKEGAPLYYFVKEAGSIRGIPDIVICASGTFVVWELKRSIDECRKTTGRIVLQRYTLQRIQRAKGYARLVCPENFL